jgi:hypothetical protein
MGITSLAALIAETLSEGLLSKNRVLKDKLGHGPNRLVLLTMHGPATLFAILCYCAWDGVNKTSMRRFMARPSGVVSGASGRLGP